MPVIGGFVGGDTVAGILATGLADFREPSLLVDIGTNGEIVLQAGGRLWAASTAAGPAFEGAANLLRHARQHRGNRKSRRRRPPAHQRDRQRGPGGSLRLGTDRRGGRAAPPPVAHAAGPPANARPTARRRAGRSGPANHPARGAGGVPAGRRSGNRRRAAARPHAARSPRVAACRGRDPGGHRPSVAACGARTGRPGAGADRRRFRQLHPPQQRPADRPAARGESSIGGFATWATPRWPAPA